MESREAAVGVVIIAIITLLAEAGINRTVAAARLRALTSDTDSRCGCATVARARLEGGIGAVAMLFGATELVSSLGSAAFADRIGKLRTTLGGIATLLVGLAVMISADDRLGVGIAGLVVFLLGFELAFVVSLSLVSESMPDARGSTLAVSNAVGTVARASGAVISGWLYGVHGIAGTAGLSAVAAVVAVLSLLVSRRPQPTIPVA